MKITKKMCKEFLNALPNEPAAKVFKNNIDIMRKMFKEIENCYNGELDDEESISLDTIEQGEYFMEFAEFKRLVYENAEFYTFDLLGNLILSLPKFLAVANKLGFDFQLSTYLKHLEKINREIEKNIKKNQHKYKGGQNDNTRKLHI